MTIYDGLVFKTRLEAQWAAFFDLAGWEWRINPVPVGDWAPDFRVTFPCGHSECGPAHTLLVSIVPTADNADLLVHPVSKHRYSLDGYSAADTGAVFGSNPDATRWEFSHGAGSGVFDVSFFEDNASALWEQAGKLVNIEKLHG